MRLRSVAGLLVLAATLGAAALVAALVPAAAASARSATRHAPPDSRAQFQMIAGRSRSRATCSASTPGKS